MRPLSKHLRAAGGERGIALISALLMMMVMSALAIALTASGRVEVAMGDNEELYAGARAAAESGLNHTAAIIIQQAMNPVFPLNNLLTGPDLAADPANEAAASNADNGIVTHLLGGAAPWPVAAGSAYSYDVRIFDDDDPALNNGAAFTLVQRTAMSANKPTQVEDGLRFNDVNKRLVIRSVGFGPRGTTSTLEQMLTPITMPALLVNGNLLLTGNASITGDQGSVHANNNLEIDGNSVVVEQSCTATGDLSHIAGWAAGDVTSGGMPLIPVPDIHADDYFNDADYVLQLDGRITNRDESVVYCNAASASQSGYKTGCRDVTPPAGTAPFGWRYRDSSQTWDLNPGGGGEANQATYFSEGDVTVTGSPGTSMAPLRITIIARGDIVVTGNPDLRPEPASELQFVTDQDLRIAGDIMIPTAYEGRILVREQIDFAGSADLAGQVIVQDVPSISNEVEDNQISGTVNLTYNGLVETVAYTVSGWRETQQ
jgi:Tfp pilus assembly protein PilX